MNIIFIAPPAAGKGTQSELVCKKYNLTHISTGNLLREVTTKDDDFSKEIKMRMSKGLLISDEIILNLISEKIKNKDGFIFDGFPRNIKQAIKFDEMLDNINQKIDYVIYLKITEEIAKERILGRLVCPKCNNVYNFGLNVDNQICSNCNETLIKRQDDIIETFEKRFKVYMDETSPIIDYYKNKGNLYEVDSSLSPEEVFKQIEKIIGEKWLILNQNVKLNY